MGGFSTQSGVGNDGLGSVMNADNLCFNGTSRGECVVADGQLLIGSSTGQRIKPATLTAGTGISIANGPNSITISAPGSTTDYHVERFIVGDTAYGATHSTFAAALAAAVAAGGNQTIAFQPGTYTGDYTWPANINLVAFDADAQTPNVTIVGKATCTDAGARTASGIRFQTNADNFLAVTGSAATVVNLQNCYLDCTNANGITFSSSSASAIIRIYRCRGDINAIGITAFVHSSAGLIDLFYTIWSNTGLSITASTASSGSLNIRYTTVGFAITTSGTNQLGATFARFDTSNLLCLTIGGSGVNKIRSSMFASGTASNLSISATAQISLCSFESTNASPITGAGTIKYNGLTFIDTGTAITTTTQTVLEEGPSKTIGSSNSGSTNTLLVTNDSNTATSKALIQTSVAGTTADDPFHTFTILGTTNWSIGADNSITSPVADPFKLSASATLGTTDVIVAQTSGEINYPLQSSFMAVLGSDDNNQTGDGTTYTIGTSIALTEIFDQNSDFNTNGTFTAPVTGKYLLNMVAHYNSLGAAHTNSNMAIVTTARTYQGPTLSPGACRSSGNFFSAGFSVIADMTAGNTATFTINVSGSTKTVGLRGTSGSVNYVILSGQLLA